MAGRIVGSVSARLELDSSQFSNSIKTIKEQLTALTTAISEFNKVGSAKELVKMADAFKSMESPIETTTKLINENTSAVKKNKTAQKEIQTSLTATMKAFETTGKGVQSYINALNRKYQSLASAGSAGGRGYFDFLNMTGDFAKQSRVIKDVLAGFKLLDQQLTGFHSKLNSATRKTQLTSALKGEMDTISREMGVYQAKLKYESARKIKADREFAQKIWSNTVMPASFAGNSFANHIVQNLRKETQTIEREQGVYQAKLQYLAQQRVKAEERYANEVTRRAMSSKYGYSGYLNSLGANGRFNTFTATASYNQAMAQLDKQTGSSSTNVAKLNSSMNSASTSITRVGTAMQSTTAKGTQMNSMFSSLIGGAGRLKSMFTMVSSLFVWQFASSLIEATGESINAKSELESLFNSMNMGSGSIKRFNEGLDATVNKFQKLNKYSMGETVASLGVEFDLTTEQMTKAMPILAMIQSEYLRAGRTTEEATLAVKDIMQGELLRLSRETGVGQSELKQAGWNGAVQTKEDIDSLLNALDKVGKSRHWDVFASKATSLNDVLLITKNRFSEFSADIVGILTPAVLAVFNTLTSIIDGIGGAFHNLSGFWKGALGLPTFILALGTAVTALIHFRTGLGLVEIANVGFGRSLVASILKIDAFTLKTFKLREAITAMITGYEVAQVAEVGWGKALASRILGLDLGIVKTHGFGNAMLVASGRINEVTSLMYKAKGVSLSWYQALAVLAKGTSVAEANTMTFAQSLRAVLTSMVAVKVVAFTSVILALAVAFGNLYMQCRQAKEMVDRFNYVLENGDDIVQKAQETYDSYSKSIADVQNQMAGMDSTSTAYAEKQKELNNLLKEQKLALGNVTDAEKANARAKEIQRQVDQKRASTLNHNKQYLEEAYSKLNLDPAEIYTKSTKYMNDVEKGGAILLKSAEEYDKRIVAGTKHWVEHQGQMEKAGYSIKDIESYIDDYNTQLLQVAENWEKFNQGDMWAGVNAVLGEIWLWWIEFSKNKEFIDFWNTLNAIWRDCEPVLRDIYNLLKGLGWEVFKDLAGALSELHKHLGTGGTLVALALGIGGVTKAIKLLGTTISASNVLTNLPVIGGVIGGGKGSGSRYPEYDEKDTGKKKKDKKSKTSSGGKKGSGRLGNFFLGTGNLVADLKSQAKMGVQMATGLAIVMGLITEAIILLQAPMWAIGEVGKYWDHVKVNFNKGCEALKAMSDALLENIPLMIAFIVVITTMGNSPLIGQGKTLVQGVIGIAVAITLISEAIYLLKAPLWAIGEVGKGFKKGQVDKGIEAIDAVSNVLLHLAPFIPVFLLGVIACHNVMENPELFLSLVAGIALGIGLITEAIILLVAPLGAMAVVGAMASGLKGKVEQGVKAIQLTTDALTCLVPWVPVFILGVSISALAFTGVGAIALPVVVTGIAVGIGLVTESIALLVAPLGALAELGSVNIDTGAVKEGAERIKQVGEALGYLNEAMNSVTGIAWDNLSTWLATGGKGLTDVINNISADDGILPAMAKFPEEFNKVCKDMKTIDPALVESLKKSADALKSIDDAIGYIKNIMGNTKNLGGNNNTTTVAGANSPQQTGLQVSLNIIKQDIQDIMDFNSQLEGITVYAPPTELADSLSQSVTVLGNIKSACDSAKQAIQSSNEAGQTSKQATGIVGQIGAFFFGSKTEAGAGGSSLKTGLVQLYNDVLAIIDFNNDINSAMANVGNGGEADVSGLTSMVTAVSDAIKQVADAVNNGIPQLKLKATAMGQSITEGFKSGLGSLGSVLTNEIGTAFNTASSDAISKARSLGTNVVDGFKFKVDRMSVVLKGELSECLTAMDNSIPLFRAKGEALGSAVTEGFNSKNAIDYHSPGTMARLLMGEMGEIHNVLVSSVNTMFLAGQSVGSAITNGMSSTQGTDIGLSFDTNAVATYVSDISQAMALTQSTATGATNTFVGMDNTANLTFGNMGQTITGTFDNINLNATSNYNKLANTTKLQLGNMQSQTTRNIEAIKSSWNGMQTALIGSAENIRSQTSQKIGSLENNMARFWRKIQNPANLIAGVAGGIPAGRRMNTGHRSVSRPVARVISGSNKMYAGGMGIDNVKYPKRTSKGSPSDLSIEWLDCLLNGEECYAGGWNFNWTPRIMKQLMNWRTHFGEIYDAKLRVGKFENDDFPVRRDTDIFKNYVIDAISRTTYEGYFNSKYGSALNAWNAGHFNCYDGMLVVMALANAFGLSATQRSGHWNGIPHVWAYVEGVGDVDATAIQGGYGLTSPKVSGGVPSGSWKSWASGDTTNNNNNSRNVNITVNVDLSNSNVGIEDIDKHIGDVVVNKVVDMTGANPATGL